MNDDRTEQALRRALDDAARQVDVPMASLPEPALARDVRPPRRPLVAAACVAAIAMLVAASLIAFGSDDNGMRSIASGGLTATPIMADDADLDIVMDLDVSDEQLAVVRSFAEDSSDISAYTVVSGEQGLEELRATSACEPTRSYVATLVPDEINVHVRIRLARFDDFAVLGRELAALPGVEMVTNRGVRVDEPGNDAPGTTAAPGTVSEVPSRTPAPTSLPATTTSVTDAPTTTELPASTASTSMEPSSKEIAFVLPAAAQCPPGQTPTTTAVGRAPSGAAPTLPLAGEQPADRAAAEQAVRELYEFYFAPETTQAQRMALTEAYPELASELERARAAGPTYVPDGVRLFNVVFVSPTSVAVDYQMLFKNGVTDIRQIGLAVLVDGTWKMAREQTCRNIARAGVHCPEGP